MKKWLAYAPLFYFIPKHPLPAWRFYCSLLRSFLRISAYLQKCVKMIEPVSSLMFFAYQLNFYCWKYRFLLFSGSYRHPYRPKHRKIVFYEFYKSQKYKYFGIYAYVYIVSVRVTACWFSSTIEPMWFKFRRMVPLDQRIPNFNLASKSPSSPCCKHHWFYDSIALGFHSCLIFAC